MRSFKMYIGSWWPPKVIPHSMILQVCESEDNLNLKSVPQIFGPLAVRYRTNETSEWQKWATFSLLFQLLM